MAKPSISLMTMLAQFFPRLTLSPRQLEPLKAIDAGATFVLLAWGRRSGKTLVMALTGLHHSLPRAESDEFLLPGEERTIVAVATTLKQSRRLIRRAKALIKMSPVLSSMVADTTDLEIRFKHNVVFVAAPANAAGDRGEGASCLLFDEFSHHYDGQPDAPKAAEQLLASLIPATSQFGDLATVVIGSTPSGDSNKFAQLKDETIESPDDPTRFYDHGSTWDINPRITEASLTSERRLLGRELFEQEYMASFLSGGGFLLAWEAIRDCTEERGELEHHSATSWVVAIDPAFASDVFGVCVIGVDREHPSRLVVGASYGWTGKRDGDSFEARRFAEDELLDEVAKLCRRFRTQTVVTDVHKAKEIRARMASYGIEVVEVPFGSENRREVFAAVRLRIADGAIGLPSDPGLLRELRALRVRYTSRGQVVDLPHVGRSHCDRAVALSLGVFHFGCGEEYPVAISISHPSFGTRSVGMAEPDGDPAPGSAAYYALPQEEQYAICMRRSGQGGGAGTVRPSNVGRGYDCGVAWLDAPGSTNNYDW